MARQLAGRPAPRSKGMPARAQAQSRGSSLPRPPNGSESFKNETAIGLRDVTPRSLTTSTVGVKMPGEAMSGALPRCSA